MKTIPTPIYRAIALVTTFSLVNMSVPFGALAAFAPDPNAPKPMPAAVVKPAVSRFLSAAEMKGRRGRLAENPYIAGASKFGVNFHGIDLMTGNYSSGGTDLTFEGGYGVPVNVTRSYSANNPDEGPYGKGWTLSVDIRTTAGGLLKSSSAPIRSVPTAFKERPGIAGVGQSDPTLVNEPVEAVVATDASGKEETIQKDVDGILTTPPWDKNVVDSEYEMQTLGTSVYRVLLRNVLKIAEGTVYVYEKMGSYPSGARPWNDPEADPEPSNVLKIASVTDRHGNATLYTYGSSMVTFNKANGVVEEHPLIGIQMPNGHAISFTWGGSGVPSNRIRLASDGVRTVTYGYTNGLLTSVTSPAGKTTGYGYGAALPLEGIQHTAFNLLTSITDPRGLQTLISYFMTYTCVAPYEVEMPAPVAYKVREPNGVCAYFSPIANKPAGVDFPMDMTEPGVRGGFQERVGSAAGQQLTLGYLATETDQQNQTFTVRMTDPQNGHPGPAHEDIAPSVWRKTYNFFTQDLVREISYINPWRLDDLAVARKLRDLQNPRPIQRVQTDSAYNFMGAPLRKTVTEFEGTLISETQKRQQTVEYAYWGADKYFQQKAVKDGAGRISLTDYFDDQAAQGSKGQTYRVYSPKYTTYDNAGASNWKYVIVPTNPATHAAQFQYDAKGRPTDVWKLQKTTPSWAYVQTRTTYGADQTPTWGAAVEVVEDYGGIDRTTQTLEYDSIGRATLVQDASGQQFTTAYDLDGQVQFIESGPDTVVSYVYGSSGLTNGVPLQVTDHLTGIVQTMTYEPMGGGLGQVAQVTEARAEATYTVSYLYSDAGERSVARCDTPNGIRKWEYSDYLKVGPPEGGSRIFQTLTKLVLSGNDWIRSAEEFHYEFDAQGRLLEAAFAQTPQSGQSGYSAQYPAGHRARAHYEYDPGGRTVSQVHWWDDLVDNVYQSTPVLASQYSYDAVLGLKTDADFQQKAPSSNTWVSYAKQQYGYDPQLDYLTSASYDDDGNGTWEATHTWTYDAAGNRASASAQPGTWSYDNLNRMTTSPMGPYENDILGNRLWKNHNQQGGQRMEWDALSRMTSACTQTGGARYEYRADGMRTLKVEGLSLVWQDLPALSKAQQGSGYYDAVWATNKPTTRYFYDGQMPIEDDFTRLVNNQMTVDVTRNGLGARGIDIIEKTTSSGTVTAFPLYDGHGNMAATLSRSGPGFAVNDRRSFDAWGVVRTGAQTGDPKGRYCGKLGHLQDDESGLVYMRSRYYEPVSGRFLSEDPAMQGYNWYVYCENEPIHKSDFTGRFGDIIEIDGWFFRTDKIGPGPGLADFAFGRNRACDMGSVFIDGWAKHGPQGAIPVEVLSKLGKNKKFQGWLRTAVNARAGSPFLNEFGRDSVSATFNYDPFFVIGLFVILGMANMGSSSGDMWDAWPG